MTPRTSKKWPVRIAAGVALVFGLLTILAGGRALFGGDAAQEAVGDAVPFVLWFNFLSGFVYMLAGIGILLGQRWATLLALSLVIAIAAIFALFALHVFQGGGFEMRTVGAMALRLIAWVLIAAVAVWNAPPRQSVSD